MSRPLTASALLDVDQVRRWYWDEGLSVREAAARAGVGSRTLHRYMRDNGIPCRDTAETSRATLTRIPRTNRPGPRGLTANQAQMTRDLLDVGWTIAAVARAFGVTRTTIHTAAKGESKRHADARLFRELYDKGLRGLEIDRAAGTSPGYAARFQRKHGLSGEHPLPPPAELDSLYAEAGTLRDLAKLTGCSIRRVREALTGAGIQVGDPARRRYRERPPHPLDAHREDIRRAYHDEGVPLRVLAARYGIRPGTMAAWLNREDIYRYRLLTEADHERIRELGGRGLNLSEIARETGWSIPTVKRHLTRPQQRKHPERLIP